MAVVVLVHGIAQEQAGQSQLEAKWLPALAEGLLVSGFPALADRLWHDRYGPRGIDARMAFYGGLFLQPGQQGVAMGELNPLEQAVAEQLALEWLQHVAMRAPRERERTAARQELAYLQRAIGAEEAGRGAAARSAIASLSRLRWFAPFGLALAKRFVNQALVQMTRYLTDEMIRDAALDKVMELVGPETKIIIGHSLGSVIAYEATHMLKHELALLVTLGSPLGIDTVVYPRLRPQSPRFPSALKRWVNVADPEDYVAAVPDLRAKFSEGRPSSSVLEGTYTVDNGAQPHSAVFYLRKTQVGQPVGEVLCID